MAVAAGAVWWGWSRADEHARDHRRSRAGVCLPDAPGGDVVDFRVIVRSAAWRWSRRQTSRGRSEPAVLKLDTVHRELRAFDAVSRVKRFETSHEMRAPAWAESRDVGVALFHRDQAKLLLAGEEGVFEPAGGPGGPRPHGIAVRVDERATRTMGRGDDARPVPRRQPGGRCRPAAPAR